MDGKSKEHVLQTVKKAREQKDGGGSFREAGNDGKKIGCSRPFGITLRRRGAGSGHVGAGSKKVVFVGCGRCSECYKQRARVRAAKVLDWMDAISGYSWSGRGSVLLVTLTLSATDGCRRGKAGRERLQKSLGRLKSELRRQIPLNRFGEPAGKIVLTVRSYELHADGAIHAHLVVFYEGRPFQANSQALALSAGQGIVDVSQRTLTPESVQSSILYAAKYVLKSEVRHLEEYKGTRWFQFWSSKLRVAPRAESEWILDWSRSPRWEATDRCSILLSGRWYPARQVARWCMLLHRDLIVGSASLGYLAFLKPPLPSLSVLPR